MGRVRGWGRGAGESSASGGGWGVGGRKRDSEVVLFFVVGSIGSSLTVFRI